MAALVHLRHPGAGLMGRAEDLLAIGSALLRDDGAIVRPRTLAMMRRPLTGEIPRLEPYPAERGQDWGLRGTSAPARRGSSTATCMDTRDGPAPSSGCTRAPAWPDRKSTRL